MRNVTELYPNPQVSEAVYDYSIRHSKQLPPHIDKHKEDSIEWCKANGEEEEMMINPLQAQLFVWLSRSRRAKKVLEVGCFTGYSALAWAEGLRDADGREVITLDLPGKASEFAQKAFEKYGVDSYVKLITGDAKDVLPTLAGKVFDLIFLDADKPGYITYLEQILKFNLLAPHGLLLADNVLRKGTVADSSENNPAVRNGGYEEANIKSLDKFNKFVRQKADEGVFENIVLPVFDGLNVIGRVELQQNGK